MLRFFSVLVVLRLALAGGQVGAEEAKSVTTESTKLAQPVVKSERAISSHAAELLAAARPKLAVAKTSEKTSPQPTADTAIIRVKPANEIVRLPQVTVRGLRVPPPDDVRTPRGLELYAMKKYLGSSDNFSRGVLNHFTIAEAWKHVPLLGRFPWFSSPEKTALDLYYDDEMRQKMKDLYGILAIKVEQAPSLAPVAPTPPDK